MRSGGAWNVTWTWPGRLCCPACTVQQLGTRCHRPSWPISRRGSGEPTMLRSCGESRAQRSGGGCGERSRAWSSQLTPCTWRSILSGIRTGWASWHLRKWKRYWMSYLKAERYNYDGPPGMKVVPVCIIISTYIRFRPMASPISQECVCVRVQYAGPIRHARWKGAWVLFWVSLWVRLDSVHVSRSRGLKRCEKVCVFKLIVPFSYETGPTGYIY